MNEPTTDNENELTHSPSEEQLSKKERKKLKRQRMQEKKENEKKSLKKKGLGVNIIIIVGILGTIAVFIWLFSNQGNLPPTIQEGHIEVSPPSHILTTPIPENIQRHMLEHADGKNRPGIIIQYNCENYTCEPDLIDKLTSLVQEYPEHVYLAPNNYDGKIILTKQGKRKILDAFDEAEIREFIR